MASGEGEKEVGTGRMKIRQNMDKGGPLYYDSATAFMKGVGEEVLPLLSVWVHGVNGGL